MWKKVTSPTMYVLLQMKLVQSTRFSLSWWRKKKKRKPEKYELPQFQREVLPPIYKGKDPSVFNELLLEKGMHEEYVEMPKEYFDNVKNTEKVENLRIV